MSDSVRIIAAILVVSVLNCGLLQARTRAHEITKSSFVRYPFQSNKSSNDQQDSVNETEVNKLVVMIEYPVGEPGPEQAMAYGAGIIFGFGADTLYIATGFHVVETAAEKGQTVRVFFHWMQDTFVDARVARHSDRSLDLAVLTVQGWSKLSKKAESLSFERLGDSGSVRSKTEVNAVGYPNHNAWFWNGNKQTVSGRKGNRIHFDSSSINRGNSGGPLVNTAYEIVGMVSFDDSSQYLAIDIDKVLTRLRQWKYPVALGREGIPLARTTFVSVSGKDDRTCALTEDGQIYCWGLVKEVSIGPAIELTFGMEPRLVKFASNLSFLTLASSGKALGITKEGTAYFWTGDDPRVQRDSVKPVVLGNGQKFLSGALNNDFVCVITAEHDAVCWKADTSSASNSPTMLGVKLTSVTVGSQMICGLATGGEAYCWRFSRDDASGNLTIHDIGTPTRVSQDLKFDSLGLGRTFGCGLSRDALVYCWGDLAPVNTQANDKKRKSSATRNPQSEFQLSSISGGLTFRNLSVGETHACAIDRVGQAYCWGNNDEGKLGNGKTDHSMAPVKVATASKFRSISSGLFHTCALTEAEGLVYCWGSYAPRSNAAQHGPTPTPISRTWLRTTIQLIHALVFEGKYAEAQMEVTSALTLYPNDVVVQKLHAALMADLGNTDQAVAEQQSILRNEPESIIARESARLYIQGGNYAQALSKLKSLQAANAVEDEDISLMSAEAYRGQGNYDLAQKVLEDLLKRQSTSAPALTLLSYLLGEGNVRLDEALVFANRASQLNPQDSSYTASLGLIYYRQRNFPEAIDNLKLAWEVVIENPAVAELLGDSYLETGQPANAITAWQNALAEWEKMPPARRPPAMGARLKQKLSARR